MELETLQNNVVAVIALVAVAGLFIGWLLTYLLIGRGPSKTELRGKLEAVEGEFETHKSNVDEHFAKTSELVNDLTESYVKVYKHLSDGAEQLGGVSDMRNRLTLDRTAQANPTEGDDKIIEGALVATAASTTATSVDAEQPETQADNPEAIAPLSPHEEAPHEEAPHEEAPHEEAAVEETLTELEQSTTNTQETSKIADPGELNEATDELTDDKLAGVKPSDVKEV